MRKTIHNARVFGFLSVNSPNIFECSRPGVYQYLILDFLIIAVMIAMLSQYFILSIRTNCDVFMAIRLNHAQLLDYLIPWRLHQYLVLSFRITCYDDDYSIPLSRCSDNLLTWHHPNILSSVSGLLDVMVAIPNLLLGFQTGYLVLHDESLNI